MQIVKSFIIRNLISSEVNGPKREVSSCLNEEQQIMFFNYAM